MNRDEFAEFLRLMDKDIVRLYQHKGSYEKRLNEIKIEINEKENIKRIVIDVYESLENAECDDYFTSLVRGDKVLKE